MKRILQAPEIVIYVAFIFFVVAFLFLGWETREVSDTPVNFLLYYLKIVISSFKNIFLWTIIFFLIMIFINFIKVSFLLFRSEPILPKIKKILENSKKEILRFGPQVLLTLTFWGLAIGQLNIFNASRLQDEMLVRWDLLLTGTHPFFSLASVQYPAYFIKAVNFSFFHLGTVIIFFAVFLFLEHGLIFRQFAAAFFIGAMIAFLSYFLFPALSPHDRFIDNVYNLPISGQIKEALNRYHPQEEIISFLKLVRERKNELDFFPTTTMPSSHVLWITLLIYYSIRVSRWLGIFFVPFGLISLFGTVLLAQHYFVDIPAGMAVAFLSIFLVHRLLMNRQK